MDLNDLQSEVRRTANKLSQLVKELKATGDNGDSELAELAQGWARQVNEVANKMAMAI